MPESIKSIMSLVFLVVVGFVAFKTAGFYFRKEKSSSEKLQKLLRFIKLKKGRAKRLKHQSEEEVKAYSRCKDELQTLFAEDSSIVSRGLHLRVEQLDERNNNCIGEL